MHSPTIPPTFSDHVPLSASPLHLSRSYPLILLCQAEELLTRALAITEAVAAAPSPPAAAAPETAKLVRLWGLFPNPLSQTTHPLPTDAPFANRPALGGTFRLFAWTAMYQAQLSESLPAIVASDVIQNNTI